MISEWYLTTLKSEFLPDGISENNMFPSCSIPLQEVDGNGE
jgi:hypothetical protein